MQRNFISAATGEFGSLSRPAWLWMLMVGIVYAVSEFIRWNSAPKLSAADAIVFVFYLPVALIAGYFSAIAMASRMSSIAGLGRFIVSTTALLSPILAGLALLLLSGPHRYDLSTIGIVLIVIGWVLLTFLPAWPIAQTLSNKLVNPMTLWRGTKGHRWSLFSVTFLSGAFNKMAPDTSKASNIKEAIAYSAANGLIAIITMILFVSVAITAWRFASKNNPTLYGNTPRPFGV